MKKVFFVLSLLLLASLCYADIPKKISIQGRLSDSSDIPVSGSYRLRFRFYDSYTGGNLLDTVIVDNVNVDNGLFSVEISPSLSFDEAYYVEVSVWNNSQWNVLSPRVNLTSVAYSYSASKLLPIEDLNMENNNIKFRNSGVGLIWLNSSGNDVSKIYDDFDLNIKTDDRLWISAPESVHVDTNNVSVTGNVKIIGDLKFGPTPPVGGGINPPTPPSFGISGEEMFEVGLADGYGWLQAYTLGFGVPIALNPNGGNVGIGMTNPGYKLDVSGDIHSSSYVRGDTGLCIGSDCRTSWPSDEGLTCADCDSRFVNRAGDTMTGSLNMSDNAVYLRNDGYHGIKWDYSTTGVDGPAIFGYGGVTIEKRDLSGRYSLANFTNSGLTVSGQGSFNYKDNANQYSLRVGGGILLKSYYDPSSNPDSYITSTTSGGKIRFRNNADGVLYGWIGNNWYIPGKLGIGTSNPGAKLDVNGDIKLSGTARKIYFGANGEGGPHGLNFSNELFMFYRTSPNNLEFEHSDGTDILVIDRDGKRVGIGTNSPDPYVGLDIRNSEPLGNRGQIIVDTYLLRNATGSAYVPSDTGGWIDVYEDNLNLNLMHAVSGKGISFNIPGGHGGITRMFIRSDGNVGIGTTSPGAKLDVNGKVKAKNVIVGGSEQGVGTDSSRMIDLGVGKTREQNAGKIAYEGWTTGALDIVGAGTSSGSRKVKLWDKVDVAGDLNVYGWTLEHHGADFKLGTGDGRSIGSKTGQRALVHDNNDVLVLNYNGDFENGTRVDGPLIEGRGALIANFLDIGDSDGYPRYVFCMQKVGSIDWTNYKPCGGNQYWWVASIMGYLYAPSSGTYYFYVTTDDGFSLHIDGSLCKASWKEQGATEYSCSKYLSKGWHKIFLQHYQGGGDERLKLEWDPPVGGRELIPACRFAYPPLWGWGLIGGVMP